MNSVPHHTMPQNLNLFPHIKYLTTVFYLRTRENQSALQLAISHRLQPVVDSLCKNGADPNVNDEHGNCPLWAAMKSKQFEIAETLVSIVLARISLI